MAFFEPSALVSRRLLGLLPWLGETRAAQVSFSGDAGRALFGSPVEQFLVDGELPRAADERCIPVQSLTDTSFPDARWGHGPWMALMLYLSPYAEQRKS